MPLSPQEMQEVFRRTVIVRKPTYGIIKGYHELPYVCLGARLDKSEGSTRVKGIVHVSPQIIIRPSHLTPNYEEVFGEENVDIELVGRVFGFLGFHKRPVECKSEKLEVSNLSASVDECLAESLDELERKEDITTGIIITPNSRYYPISVERFISSILDDEFNL